MDRTELKLKTGDYIRLEDDWGMVAILKVIKRHFVISDCVPVAYSLRFINDLSEWDRKKIFFVGDKYSGGEYHFEETFERLTRKRNSVVISEQEAKKEILIWRV